MYASKTTAATRLGVFLLIGLGACEVPTKLPTWDQKWLIPGDSTTIGVSQMLPPSGNITVGAAGGQPAAFLLSVTAPGSYSKSLGQICSACAAANGATVPKPAFLLQDSMTTSLPADLVSATVVSGAIIYTITNNFSFDPIRPNAAGAPYGYFVISAVNGSTMIAKDSVDGSRLPIGKNGATLQLNLPILPNGGSVAIDGTAPLKIYLTLYSPQGDPVTIDANQSFSVSVQPQPIVLTQAQVRIGTQNISAAQTNIDLSSVSDQTLINRVQGGTLHLTIASPFGVQGTFTASFNAAGTSPIVKTIPLTTATQQSPDISLSAAEMRSLLGHDVSLAISGSVTSPSGSVTITPTQVLKVTSTIEIILSTTEN